MRGIERGPLDAAVGRVEPADDRVEPEQLGIDHQGEGQIEIGLVLLQMGPLLHQLHQVAAVHLDHVVDVDAGQAQGHQHLDDQLVTRAARTGPAACAATEPAPPGPRP